MATEGLIDQFRASFVTLCQSSGVLPASAWLQRSAALAVVARLKSVAVWHQKQSLAADTDSFGLICSFKDQDSLGGRSFGVDLRVASDNGAGDVVKAPATGESADCHLKRSGGGVSAPCRRCWPDRYRSPL